MSRLGARELRVRLEMAERAIGVGGVGWEMLHAVVAAWAIVGDAEHTHVIGIEVDGPHGRVVVERQAGETLAGLFARVNPTGGLRVRPRLVSALNEAKQ